MKGIFTLLAIIFLFSANLEAQTYTYLYNPYSRMNEDQLNLALEQSHKMKRNGMVWTAVGTGMMAGGAVMMYDGIEKMIYEDVGNIGSFIGGLGIMCFGAFPLTFGLAYWITGGEKANQIEIELLAFDTGKLYLKPTDYGLGLTLAF